MRAIIPFKRTQHKSGSGASVAQLSAELLADPPANPAAPLVPTPTPHETAIACPARVLSVGRIDEDILIREPLERWPGFCFSHANDYLELWALSRGHTYDAVLFHNSLGCFELEEAARLVRRRWPSAIILLVRSGEITLEDPLYDHRLRPPVDPKTLLSALSAKPPLPSQKHWPRWRVAHALGN
jgi:hypothetical protein